MPGIAEGFQRIVVKNPAALIDNSGLFPEGAQTQIKRAYEFRQGLLAAEVRLIIASAGVPDFFGVMLYGPAAA